LYKFIFQQCLHERDYFVNNILKYIFTAYLYSFGKTATVQVTEQVAKTAKQLKETIDDKVNITDNVCYRVIDRMVYPSLA